MSNATELERRQEAGLSARAITVHGVGDENAGAHDAEKRGNGFEHGD